jgi:nucleoside-diphosphate-sugar epimerase
LHAISRAARARNADWRWWQGDLTDFAQVKQVVSAIKPDLIYHLAGLVVGSRDLALVLPILHANLVSTVNLLTAAAENGCLRVVLAGSMEEPRETDVVPSSPYAAAKWAASGYARMFHSLYAMHIVSARIAMVYGPGQSDTSKLIPYVIRSLVRGEAPQLSSGQREVDWIYVDDVVDAMTACANVQDQGCLSVEIGSGNRISIREIAERLCQIINPAIRPIFGAIADRPCDRSWSADIALAREKLGWQPRTQLDDGLRTTVDWHRGAALVQNCDKLKPVTYLL